MVSECCEYSTTLGGTPLRQEDFLSICALRRLPNSRHRDKTMPDATNHGFEYEVPQYVIDYYAENGAVRLEQPFDSYWIDGLLDGFEEIMRGYETGSTEYPVARQEGKLGIQNVVLRHPFYRKWAIESPVAEIVGQVTQSDTIRFYFDYFFCKEGDQKKWQRRCITMLGRSVSRAPKCRHSGSH